MTEHKNGSTPTSIYVLGLDSENPRPGSGGLRVSDEDDSLFAWLRDRHEFTSNPFPPTDTERDGFLQRHFLSLPVFRDCLTLAHSVILGATGSGKSALAWAQTRHFSDTFTARRVLGVTHTVRLPAEGTRPPDRSEYLRQFLESVVRQSFIALAQFGHVLPRLTADPALAAVFADWFDAYLPYLDWRQDLNAAAETESLRQVLTSLDVGFDADAPPAAPGTVNGVWLRKWLALIDDPACEPDSRFALPVAPTEPFDRVRVYVALLIEVGVREVVLAVDGFDPFGDKRPADTIRAFLRPLLGLLRAPGRIPHLFFKLFVPDDIGNANDARTTLELSPSVDVIALKWRREQLRDLLKARLSYASGGVVKSLNQLTNDPANDYDTYVLEGGYRRRGVLTRRARTPREVLDRARILIVAHWMRPASGEAIRDCEFDERSRRWVETKGSAQDNRPVGGQGVPGVPFADAANRPKSERREEWYLGETSKEVTHHVMAF